MTSLYESVLADYELAPPITFFDLPVGENYGSRQQLAALEIAAFPYLMRVVEAEGAIYQPCRQLAAGVNERNVNRLYRIRMLGEWLGQNTTYVDAMMSQ